MARLMRGRQSRSGTMQVRIAAVLVIVVGLALLGSVVINDLFAVGPAFEEMIDDFRPMLQDDALAQMQGDLQGMGVVYEEITTEMLPGIAAQLGQTPEAFGAFLGTNFPAVAAGLDALPAIGEQFGVVAGTLADNQTLFFSADAIPTDDLPATTVPWGMLFAGIAAVVVGVVMFITGRWGAVLAVVLGALLVIVPLMFSLPTKAADADQLNDNLEPVYTAEMVAQGSGGLEVMTAMGVQMQQDMLPALAQQLQMTPEQLQAFLGENFPATAGLLTDFQPLLGRFTLTLQTFDANLDNYDTLKPVAFVPIVWTIIIGGFLILLAGGWALASGFFVGREPEVIPADEEAPRKENAGAGV